MYWIKSGHRPRVNRRAVPWSTASQTPRPSSHRNYVFWGRNYVKRVGRCSVYPTSINVIIRAVKVANQRMRSFNTTTLCWQAPLSQIKHPSPCAWIWAMFIYLLTQWFTITEQLRSINKSIPCNSHSWVASPVLNLIPLSTRHARARAALHKRVSFAGFVWNRPRHTLLRIGLVAFFKTHNNLIGKYLWKGWPDAD